MDCSICLENIKDPFISICKHQFCNKCITEWIVSNNNCPICRKNLTNSDSDNTDCEFEYIDNEDSVFIVNYLDKPHHYEGIHYTSFLDYLYDLHVNIIKYNRLCVYKWFMTDENCYAVIIKKKHKTIKLHVEIYQSDNDNNRYYYTLFGSIDNYNYKSRHSKYLNYKTKLNSSFKYNQSRSFKY